MLILVEGVDGSGKSTLCKKLEEHGYSVYRDERDFDKNRLNIVMNLWSSPMKYVCDRSFMTDIVYRSLLGGQHGPVSFQQAIKFLDQDYREDSCKIIYCKSSTSFEDSMKRGEDNIVTKDMSDAISQRYEFFIDICNEWLKTPVMIYNWRENTIQQVIKFIEGGKL